MHFTLCLTFNTTLSFIAQPSFLKDRIERITDHEELNSTCGSLFFSTSKKGKERTPTSKLKKRILPYFLSEETLKTQERTNRSVFDLRCTYGVWNLFIVILSFFACSYVIIQVVT